MWDKAENMLRKVLTDLKLDFYEAEDEAAFYGPKLDVQIKSAIGHDVTLSTCQLDFLLPERFDLSYIDEHGEKQRPVVLHRAILGTFDRFTAFLLEETKGNLPTWLAPIQINIIPVNNEYHLDYAKEIEIFLKQNGFRVELDSREEKLSYKMRESQTKKIPFTLILGDKERDNDIEQIEEKIEEKKQLNYKNKKFLIENNIDVDAAEKLLGEMSTYDDALADFIKEADSKYNLLQGYMKIDKLEKCYNIFRTIKTDTRYLGFIELNSIFSNLEKAIKENDIDYVKNNIKTSLKVFKKYIEISKEYLGK